MREREREGDRENVHWLDALNAGKFPENPFFPKDFFPEKSSRIFPIFFSWKFFFPKKEIPKFLIPEKNFSRKPFPENKIPEEKNPEPFFPEKYFCFSKKYCLEALLIFVLIFWLQILDAYAIRMSRESAKNFTRARSFSSLRSPCSF